MKGLRNNFRLSGGLEVTLMVTGVPSHLQKGKGNRYIFSKTCDFRSEFDLPACPQTCRKVKETVTYFKFITCDLRSDFDLPVCLQLEMKEHEFF